MMTNTHRALLLIVGLLGAIGLLIIVGLWVDISWSFIPSPLRFAGRTVKPDVLWLLSALFYGGSTAVALSVLSDGGDAAVGALEKRSAIKSGKIDPTKGTVSLVDEAEHGALSSVAAGALSKPSVD